MCSERNIDAILLGLIAYPFIHIWPFISPSFLPSSRNRHRSNPMHEISLAGRIDFREADRQIHRLGISRFPAIVLERTCRSTAVICAMIGPAIRLIALTSISHQAGSFSVDARELRRFREFLEMPIRDSKSKPEDSRTFEACILDASKFRWFGEGRYICAKRKLLSTFAKLYFFLVTLVINFEISFLIRKVFLAS